MELDPKIREFLGRKVRMPLTPKKSMVGYVVDYRRPRRAFYVESAELRGLYTRVEVPESFILKFATIIDELPKRAQMPSGKRRLKL